MVSGGIRNLHEGKVPGQMANATNHHPDRHGTDDYLNIVHRLGNEVNKGFIKSLDIMYNIWKWKKWKVF